MKNTAKNMKVQKVICGSYMENCYVYGNDKEVMIVDPGDDAQKIISAVGDREVKYIFNTHGHVDHIGAVSKLREHFNSPFGIHVDEKPLLLDPAKNLSGFTGNPIILKEADIYFKDKDQFDLGDTKVTIIHTPGHTLGGCCFLADNVLFSGDTLFNMSVGRTDFPGGSYDQLLKSIKKQLMTLNDNVSVYPGHMGETTIGYEKKNNPFLR